MNKAWRLQQKNPGLTHARGRRTLLYGRLHPDPEVLVMKIEDADGSLDEVVLVVGGPMGTSYKNSKLGERPIFRIRAGNSRVHPINKRRIPIGPKPQGPLDIYTYMCIYGVKS
jgi:hypothetical protein